MSAGQANDQELVSFVQFSLCIFLDLRTKIADGSAKDYSKKQKTEKCLNSA